MESEKYNLIKVQEEADKFKQKVESGEVSNYGDAEKLVEQETKKREAIASQIGLKTDSKLVEALGSLDKGARDEHISSLSDEAQFFKYENGDYANSILAKVFQALNNEAIASRIQTPEDFRRYADKVMKMAKTHVMYDDKGNIDTGDYASAAVGGAEQVVEDVQSIAALSRGDFDRDFDIVLQMMRENPNNNGSVAQTLSRIRGFVRSSEDLERVGQFVKRLSEHGFSAQSQLADIFGNQFANREWNQEKQQDEYFPDREFAAWQEVITDGKKLDDALSVMEAAFTHGANPKVFVNGIGRRFIQGATPEQRRQLEEHISSLSDEAQFFKYENGDYANSILAKVFQALNNEAIASRIQTPEDFRRYADKVMKMAKTHVMYDDKGNIDTGDYASAAVGGAEQVVEDVQSIAALSRGDFDRDFDIVLQMMRENPNNNGSVAQTLSRIRGFVRSSEDLERVGQFVKRLSEHGFSAQSQLADIFGNQFANREWNQEKQQDEYFPDREFAAWQEVITDGKKLDDALSVMEAAFTHGANPKVFVNGIGRRFIQGATPEQRRQLEEHISSLSDEAQFFKYENGDYANSILAKVFQALNNEAIASRIQTPEDFRRYADKVMKMAKTHVMYDDKGNIDTGDYASAAVGGAEQVVEDVQSIAALSRGDFDRDFDIVLQMMRENPNNNGSVAQTLSRIRGFVRSSEDLERVGQFVKRLSEHGFSAQSQLADIFGNQFANREWNQEKQQDEYFPDRKFTAWQEVITDGKKLDDALSVMEAAFTHGANPKVFVKKINFLPKNEREQLIQLAQKFATKDIPPQFVADNLPLLQDCDFSKDGLALFTSFEAQKKWLEYCVQVWKKNPQNIENIAKFFNESLASQIKSVSKKEYEVGNIKGLSTEELADIQENVDEELGSTKEITKPNEKLRAFASKLLQSSLEELYENKNFEAIVNLQPAISIPEFQTRISLYTLSALLFERADVKHSLNLEKIGENAYRSAFEIAKHHSQEWQDEQTIAGPFQAGAETFGYKRMLEYISRNDSNLAQQIAFFKEVILDYPNFKKFDSIEDVAYQVILNRLADGNMNEALEIQDRFKITEEKFSTQEYQAAVYNGFLVLLRYGNVSTAFELKDKFSLRLSPIENKAVELFGEFLSFSIFREMKDLENGTIGKELAKIGVNKSGEAGVLEITEKMRELKSKFAGHNPEQLDFEQSGFMTNYFLAYTGFQNSEWGGTGVDDFLQFVKTIKSKKFNPLRKEFEIVETYPINKKKRSSVVDKSLYRQDFLERFAIILEDVKKAKDGLKNKKPLSEIAKEIEKTKIETINNLKTKIKELSDNPKAQIGLNNRIQLLEKINVRSVLDFQENYKILSSFKEFERLLRQTVFTMGFTKNRKQLEKSLDDMSLDSPTLDDVSWVVNFVDHITNQETMAQYFTDKQAKKQFEKIINPQALIEQMDILHKGQQTSGTINITFSTHRDLHIEISGQTGDACWASRYNSILKSFPNFSSIVMTKDKGGKYEKIVGSGLLIETKAENGDDLLIIRGLNPQENTINSLDVKSFFSAVVDYVKKLAETTGKKIAISIDDHSGGHTTNRPVLFNYISNLSDAVTENIRLLDPKDSNFNGYDLQGDVYLLKV